MKKRANAFFIIVLKFDYKEETIRMIKLINQSFDFSFLLSRQAFTPQYVSPPPTMATPTTPVVVSRPVAPQDWRVAKPDPAATFPTPACIPAAIDLAAMPAVLNPNALIDRLEATTIPPAVVTPITVLSATFSVFEGSAPHDLMAEQVDPAAFPTPFPTTTADLTATSAVLEPTVLINWVEAATIPPVLPEVSDMKQCIIKIIKNCKFCI